ncbi:Zinc finger PMZ-type [Arabidopsis thaliana x Arabidopsis arenosa]|uniref:Zinc finger PMZ-type n=1 Tax=Arabidopsis thaliana x Arabidopsis arenosa TaxID=1240361 RepID=A0A8T2C3F5_9BRAS|nr:Zinc finger PMZ-type [Arabidopsis thaliana x Arabidopsis arenosa]
MDETVLAISGEWICLASGKWEFRVAPNREAKCVSFTDGTVYEELLAEVVRAYGLNTNEYRPSLSFWYFGETQVLTQGHMPPVSIGCEVSLRKFKSKRRECNGLNMFVSFVKVDRTANDRDVVGSLDDDELLACCKEVEDLYRKSVVHKNLENGGLHRQPLPAVDPVVQKANIVDKEMVTRFVDKGKGLVHEDDRSNFDPIYEDEDDVEEPTYDFDRWSSLINKEYPMDWDPYARGCGQVSNIDNREDGPDDGVVNMMDHSSDGQQLMLLGGNIVAEGGGVNVNAPGSSSAVGVALTEENGNRETLEMVNFHGHDDDHTMGIDECEMLLLDDQPFRDNIRGVGNEVGDMDLKKAADAIYVGRVFKNKVELRDTLRVFAMKRLFHFKVKRSDKTRMIANCVDPKCKWRVFAKNHKNSENLEIRKVNLKHTCDVSYRSRFGRNASARILAKLMQSKFSNGKKGPRACELPEMILAELNVTISYMKAWNAKEMAVCQARGSEVGSYKYLNTYLHLLKTSNPGTITEVLTSVDKKGNKLFKYLFFALGASIAGIKYLRKVVVIDGTQLKGRFKGCLVAASGQDGNMQIYPIAFGVVDNENEDSWVWFFTKLKDIVPDEEELVFVSDRHAAIISGLKTVYPLAHHAACSVHLYRNVKHNFKCPGLAAMVSNAARSFTVGDLDYWLAEIDRRKPKCTEYLMDIGLSFWTLAHCPQKRYNLMSSNISESLNAALVKAVDYPIVSTVEFIRTMLMRWFYLRRKLAAKTESRCTPEVEDILIEHLGDSVECAVLACSDWIYQVNDGMGIVYEVDLQSKTCSCKVFDTLMIPCCHALAAVGVRNIDIYSLIGECYFVGPWMKMYEMVIRPIPKEGEVEIPEEVKVVEMKPPKTRRGGGRPKKKRIPSRGETKVSVDICLQ